MSCSSPSCSDPLPLASSPRNSPVDSPSYSAPLLQTTWQSCSPGGSSPPLTNIEDIATPLNFNLPPPCPVNEFPPLYFYGENQLNYYILGEMIGFAGHSPVYKALLSPFGCEPLKIPVAVMPVNHEDEEYRFVVSMINQNRVVDSPNVLAVREEVNVGGRLWLVFDYVGPSARVLYPRGAPLPVIASTLFDTVKGLVSIHRKKLVHGDVNIGNIYVQEGPPYLCKLGFGATRHVCVQTPHAPECLPLCQVCSWGDAPEVHDKMIKSYRTSSSDVWQLGVSAVELAIGNMWVKDRDGFTHIVRRATKVWDFGVFEDADFKKFLVDCLNENPKMRPTSEQLLYHDLFGNNHL